MRNYVFVNGEFVPLEDARISVADRGFLYGDGFFTTMRAEAGTVFFLKEHLGRLKSSCDAFRIRFPDQLSDFSLFKELLRVNDLLDKIAAVKIVITRGIKQELGLPYGDNPTYVVFARPYHPPLEAYKKGWKLVSFCFPRSSPISSHKSLNYLYNMWAREYAVQKGGDEAILIGADGYVKETSVGTILFQKDGRWFSPAGDDILPGITFQILSKLWKERETAIEKKKVKLEDLLQADQVLILNSLIGVVPVKKVDGHILPKFDPDFAAQCRRWLWHK